MGARTGVKQLEFSYDRLYGRVNFTQEDLRLFQTRELARLRQVYLSAVPPWTIPAGTCATRFEHSLGVGHLARLVGRKREFREIARDLYFAALAHDLGSPPFSHVSEPLLEKIFGKNHEEFIDDVLQGSEFAKEARRQGAVVKTISKLVRGNLPPFSDILNGTIDIDNLDNSLRFCLSMGILQRPNYSPQKIARGYSMRKGELVFQKGLLRQIKEWEQTRQIAYEFVYGPANLPPGTMLQRALDFAYQEGELGRDFFFLTDEEAFRYLEEKANPRTRTLMKRIRLWQFYPRLYKSVTTGKPLENQDEIADGIARALGAAPEDVAVYAAYNKGFKKIHLPILGARGETRHVPKAEPSWITQVFVHPKFAKRTLTELKILSKVK